MKFVYTFVTYHPILTSNYRYKHNTFQMCSATSKPRFDPSVYLVTCSSSNPNKTVSEIAHSAMLGDGHHRRATVVQLRDKTSPYPQRLQLAHELRRCASETNTCFIVNDDPELAMVSQADGVHVGQDDMSVHSARQIIGGEKIIGVSAGTVAEAVQAVEDGADYIGVGAIFQTTSKHDAGDPIGCEMLRQITQAIAGRIPVVAIGGIDETNAMRCVEAGANGVAVVSAIMKSETPAMAAAQLWQVVHSASNSR